MNSIRTNRPRFVVAALATMVVVAWAALSLVVLPVAIPEAIRWVDENVGRGLFRTAMSLQIGGGLLGMLGMLLMIYLIRHYERRQRMPEAGRANR